MASSLHSHGFLILTLLSLLLVLPPPASFLDDSLLTSSSQGMLADQEKVPLGSAPPNCRSRCNHCSPCTAVQDPAQPSGLRPGNGCSLSVNQYSNYKPLEWKCSCGDHLVRDVWLESNRTVVTSCREVELRCLRRSDLIETMASKLPSESIRFGCKVVAVKLDHTTFFPVLFTEDGIIIKAKVLIGCDGSDSVIAKSLQLKDPKLFPIAVVRGFTTYQSPHSFGTHFLRVRSKSITFGRIPINDKLVHWFIGLANPAGDHLSQKDLNCIKKIALDSVRELPSETSEIVKHCGLDSLSIHSIWYGHPWHLCTGELSNGTMTVAGDAMHVMGPFLGQGGSAGLEDAIVLARCLTQAMPSSLENSSSSHSNLHKRIDAAYRNYIKERRLRVIRLSTQSYLTGLIITTKSWIVRVICVALLMVLFGGNTLSHTRFNCGLL